MALNIKGSSVTALGKDPDYDASLFDLCTEKGLYFRMKIFEHVIPTQQFSWMINSKMKYMTKDLVKGRDLDKILLEDPQTFIDFSDLSSRAQQRLGVTQVKRRMNRAHVKYKEYHFFERGKILDFLNYLLNNKVFWGVVLLAGLLNVVSQILWAQHFEDLSQGPSRNLPAYYGILFLDHFVLLTLVLEIALWCAYDLKIYLRSYMFSLTLIAVISIAYMTIILQYNGMFWYNLNKNGTSMWILKKQKPLILFCQSLRLIFCTRVMLMFKQSEIILSAVIQALPALTYVMLMMCVTTALYWLIGMTFFAEYERQKQQYVFLRYKDYGLSDGSSLLLFLFRSFTFDNYPTDLKAARELHGEWTIAYIILWIVLSNFIFSNLFGAVLVNNFAPVRESLLAEHKRLQEIRQKINDLHNLEQELIEEKQKMRRMKVMHLNRQSKGQLPINDLNSSSEDELSLNDNKIKVTDFVSVKESPYKKRETVAIRRLQNFDIHTYLTKWPPSGLVTADIASNTDKQTKMINIWKKKAKGVKKKQANKNRNSNAKKNFGSETKHTTDIPKRANVAASVVSGAEIYSKMGAFYESNIRLKESQAQFRNMWNPNKSDLYASVSGVFGNHSAITLGHIRGLSQYKVTASSSTLAYNLLTAAEALKDNNAGSIWAKDLLCLYFIAMEQLHENLDERNQLLHLCTEALLSMF